MQRLALLQTFLGLSTSVSPPPPSSGCTANATACIPAFTVASEAWEEKCQSLIDSAASPAALLGADCTACIHNASGLWQRAVNKEIDTKLLRRARDLLAQSWWRDLSVDR